ALVEPVVAALVFVVQQAELGQLRGDSFPVPFRLVQQVICAAEQVELRPVEEGLVEVVGAVPGRDLAPVFQAAVGTSERQGESPPGMVEQVEQLPLRQRPAWRLEQGY